MFDSWMNGLFDVQYLLLKRSHFKPGFLQKTNVGKSDFDDKVEFCLRHSRRWSKVVLQGWMAKLDLVNVVLQTNSQKFATFRMLLPVNVHVLRAAVGDAATVGTV